jgi:steroid delta-isomerase-like uncharacterized protein
MNTTVQPISTPSTAAMWPRCSACLDDVAHHVNEGQVRRGKDAFRAFCEHMNRCYRENLTDMVIFEAEGGTRAAAEYVVNGTYLETDEGLPEARGTDLPPAGGVVFLAQGRPHHPGRHLLQPRRLDGAGVAMIETRRLTGRGAGSRAARCGAPAHRGLPRLSLPLRWRCRL